MNEYCEKILNSKKPASNEKEDEYFNKVESKKMEQRLERKTNIEFMLNFAEDLDKKNPRLRAKLIAGLSPFMPRTAINEMERYYREAKTRRNKPEAQEYFINAGEIVAALLELARDTEDKTLKEFIKNELKDNISLSLLNCPAEIDARIIAAEAEDAVLAGEFEKKKKLPEPAIAFINGWLADNANYEEAALVLCGLARAKKEEKYIEEIINKFLDKDIDRPDLAAKILLAQGKREKARELAQKIKDRYPGAAGEIFTAPGGTPDDRQKYYSRAKDIMESCFKPEKINADRINQGISLAEKLAKIFPGRVQKLRKQFINNEFKGDDSLLESGMLAASLGPEDPKYYELSRQTINELRGLGKNEDAIKIAELILRSIK